MISIKQLFQKSPKQPEEMSLDELSDYRDKLAASDWRTSSEELYRVDQLLRKAIKDHSFNS